MFSSVSDFLNSAKESFREYERINKQVIKLTIQCCKLENSGQDLLYTTERLRRLEALRNAMSRYRAVAEFIEFLPYSEMRVVMRYRYLEDYTWEKISSRLALDGWKITPRHVWTIHSRAMAVAQELWNARTDVEGGKTNDAADL